VVFFESNGLRHRDFVLRGVHPEVDEVLALTWNAESDLLALALNCRAGEGRSRVLVWHRDNYQWYLKYEEGYEVPISDTRFDQERSYKLHVLLSGAPQLHCVGWSTVGRLNRGA
jgi:hypothetical protein